MPAIRFDKSKLNAFVQSACFARNNPQGFRIYCGAKKWRGAPRWPFYFGIGPLGSTLYLGLQGNLHGLVVGSGGQPPVFQNYHGTMDRFGNGPPTDVGPPPNQDWTLGFTDDGSNIALNSGQYAGPFPYPDSFAFAGQDRFLPATSGPVGFPPVYDAAVTMTDSLYDAVVSGPHDDPSEHPLFDDKYTLYNPYSAADVLAEAIAVARNVSLKPGQGSTGSYQEEGGRNDFFALSPYARAIFAQGNSLWYAGWVAQNTVTSQKPWDGHQTHVTYQLTDVGDAYNLDQIKVGAGNAHKAYLVSFANFPLDGIGNANMCRVLCSTFSGSGALATYENQPLPPPRFWPVRTSCVDIVANNLQLDPALPTLTGALSRWQIFFPGKKASDIPPPSSTPWNA